MVDLKKLEVLDIGLTKEQRDKLMDYLKDIRLEDECEELIETLGEENTTAQDILQEFHAKEYNIKILMDGACGLTHLQDIYFKALELEREETRKALNIYGFEDYIKYI